MAVYKVIQNVEAEDKLVGPLTFKQFIYAIIAATCIFINFKLVISTDLGLIRWLLVFLFSMPMILFGVLAAPIGGDQPTELWVLSHLKFMFRPRERIWDQQGMAETVTVTAPKKSQTALTKNLSQGEVQSRLKALATMLDSRGWAIQTTPFYQPTSQGIEANDDRLVGVEALPMTNPDVDVRAHDDILDEQASPTAQRYGALVREVEEQKTQSLAERLKHPEADKPQAKNTPPKTTEAWGIQNINPIAVINPDVPSSFDIQPPDYAQAAEPDQNLEMRLKEAEAALHAERRYDSTSPLAAERKRREQRKLLEHSQDSKSNLATSDNFSVSTIASLANRDDEGQLIKSMPY